MPSNYLGYEESDKETPENKEKGEIELWPLTA
jgi:hypothetical protein